MGSSNAVLVVDASKYMRDYMTKSLNSKGYTVYEAVDGKNAIDVLMEHNVDVIISELNLPKVSGLELLKALSNHSQLMHLPFIVLTSDKSQAAFQEAMDSGAVGYISKPFTPSEIDIKIQSIIQ